MRKNKSIKIDDREITIKELRVKDYISMFEFDGDKDPDLETIISQVKKILPQIIDVAFDELTEMAPSEIKLIWEGIKEVNDSFLEMARSLGLEKILTDIKSAILKDFSGLVASSLKQGT